MKRWYSAVVGIAAFAALAGTAFASGPSTSNRVRVSTVTPVATPALRDIQKSVNLPPILRKMVAGQNFSQQQIEQFRQKLIRAGYIKPKGEKYVIPIERIPPVMNRAPRVKDPVIQSKLFLPQPNGITAGLAFPGLGVSGGDTPGCAPPDTDMAVGASHIVEIVNLCGGVGVSYIEAWDKSGNLVLPTTSLAGLWSGGSGCEAGGGDGIVVYDQFADRWVISQFNNAIDGICVAVSQTSDPTGAYNLYNVVIDAGGFTDYPKMSVWPDAYYVATNDFVTPFHVTYTAIQRSDVIAGDPATVVTLDGSGGPIDQSMLPADVDGSAPPPAGAPGIFMNYTSPFRAGTDYQLNIMQLDVDFANPANSTLTGPTSLVVAPFNDGISSIPQPSPGVGLDSLGDRMMFRLAYRNMGDHQVLLANFTVGTGSPPSNAPAGIRWFELNAPAGSTNPADWTVAQQGTYMPADGASRWMGSIAMDHVGNIALGYSVSSTSIFPSAAYTGQNLGAPSGVMDAGEFVYLPGGGVQTSPNRWGDYSAMVVDPVDDCTFWTSQEYSSETGSFHWSTAIASFKFDNCSAGPTGTLEGTVTDVITGDPIEGATVTLTPGGFVATSDENGHYSITTAPADYSATATAFGYQPQSASVTITEGTTTTQDFALTPAATARLGGHVTDSGHGYGLYSHVVVENNGTTVGERWTNLKGGYVFT
ncbi:MAG: carboxypeptidase-like regulatory domain-containing protein, partial [Gammaproteobacteria bacterium]|nr:carboxypeptidase-like regulatory domain-containing protein [Gammaproteobacteria bacterium]